MLSHEDSNLDKQNQNLLCYHYTIGQSYFCFLLKSGAKVRNINLFCKCFMLICGGRGVVPALKALKGRNSNNSCS